MSRATTEEYSTEAETAVYSRVEAPQPKHIYNYVNIFFIALGHGIFFWYIFVFPWLQKVPLLIYSVLIGIYAGFGVTGGAHRLFTHRSYKAKLPLKLILLSGYAMSGHNNLYDWVRDHRTHHKFVETDADPHNSNRGFFFSHVGWLCMKKHPDVVTRGQTINMSDISGDPILACFNKYFIPIKTMLCFIIPTIVPHYLLNEDWYTCILTSVGRYIILLNITWSVNSVAHIFGNRPYDKSANPKENFIVSIFAIGEGWHNYHHAFPWDYKASEFGRINLSTTLLNFFGKIGWAYDFKTASNSLIKKVAVKLGDGTHEIYGYEAAFEGPIY